MMRPKTKSNEKESPFIKLKKEHTSKFIDLIKKQFGSKPIIEYKYKFVKERDYILIPLNMEYLREITQFLENNGSIDFEVSYTKTVKNPKFKYKTIGDVLKSASLIWPSEMIPKSYDIIGAISIVEFPNLMTLSNEKRDVFKKEVAKAIIKVNKSIKTVYEKVSQVKGEYRLRDLQFLYGIEDPETIHKENYAFFKVNVKRVYFTPRLVNERKRVVNNPIKKGEIIVDMFAGVGPFSIQIANKHDVLIYAFDVNFDAFNFLKENIILNQVKDKVFPYNIDITKLLEPNNQLGNSLKGKADRIIMNLPEKSLDYLEIACFLLKKRGGIIHNYQFCSKPHPNELAIEKFTQSLREYDYKIKKIIYAKTIKSYSPILDLVSLDVKVVSK